MFRKVLATSVLLFAAAQSYAAPIGEVGIGAFGSSATINFNTGVVDFTPNTDNAQVNQAGIGIFSGLTLGTLATVYDFDYKPGTNAVQDLIGKTVWEATAGSETYSFTVLGLNEPVEQDLVNQSLAINAFGSANIGGTSYTGDYSISLDKSGSRFNFSTTTTAVDVSESAIVSLFGVGLAGLGLAATRRRQK